MRGRVCTKTHAKEACFAIFGTAVAMHITWAKGGGARSTPATSGDTTPGAAEGVGQGSGGGEEAGRRSGGGREETSDSFLTPVRESKPTNRGM